MKKIAIIFGGMSTEHDVSIVSGISILKNIDKEKYKIYPIYINKQGEWYKYNAKENLENIKVGDKISGIEEINNEEKVNKGEISEEEVNQGEVNQGEVNEGEISEGEANEKEEIIKTEKIENPIKYLKEMDCIFPVLHGAYGEDGAIQGLFEMIKIPYVGCRVLASSISMDKAYTKIIFEKAGLKQAEYIYIKEKQGNYIYIDEQLNETIKKEEEIIKIAEEKLKYPMFVKPSNSGSSVGVNKVKNKEQLKDALKEASKYDKKILIEQGIKGREVECAILEENGEIQVSCVGEVQSAEEFYNFNSKYKNEHSKTQIPAKIEEKTSEEIKKQAKKAFQAVNGNGLARVDFFIEEQTGRIIINEINTMPGFTNISMYPKLFEKVGIKYTDLIEKVILGRSK